jgi:hypothetical protein
LREFEVREKVGQEGIPSRDACIQVRRKILLPCMFKWRIGERSHYRTHSGKIRTKFPGVAAIDARTSSDGLITVLYDYRTVTISAYKCISRVITAPTRYPTGLGSPLCNPCLLPGFDRNSGLWHVVGVLFIREWVDYQALSGSILVEEDRCMRSVIQFVLMAGVFALTEIGLSSAYAAEQEQPKSQNQWRYVMHNGEWWYWMPDNRWVYWRDNKWNNYNSQTYLANKARLIYGADSGSRNVNQARSDSDIRPFYGHAQSNLDRRPLESEEVGPFYGHTLPNEVFGYRRARSSIRPFYGHAVSSDY